MGLPGVGWIDPNLAELKEGGGDANLVNTKQNRLGKRSADPMIIADKGNIG